jgi:hypothetical protein
MQVIEAGYAKVDHPFLNDFDLRSSVCWIAHCADRGCIPQRVFRLRNSPLSKSEWNEVWDSVQLAADISSELGTCFVAIDCRECWLLTVMKNAQPFMTIAFDRSGELAFRPREIAA